MVRLVKREIGWGRATRGMPLRVMGRVMMRGTGRGRGKGTRVETRRVMGRQPGMRRVMRVRVR
jgi:hypothetical protein